MSRSRGDTLIEVMIAMAIIGSVIAISYATASRALRIGRSAQERTEALKLVEGQIEMLKASASLNSTVYNISTAAQSFCMRSDGLGGIVTQHLPNVDLFSDGLTSGAMVAGPVPVYDTACALGQDGRYKVSIIRSDVGVNAAERNTFTIRARWERLGGGRDEVAIYYRLHERLYR